MASTTPVLDELPIRIGISQCLMGEKVRFDGSHCRDHFLMSTVGQFVEFVPVCPEMEIGLGTPRETLRLARETAKGKPRLIAPKSGSDHTVTMERYAKRRTKELATEQLCGFILKKGSPSCGMERVKTYDHNGVPSKGGAGKFAEGLMAGLPHLPVEEEGRLNDPRLRENFFERVFAYRRLRQAFRPRWRRGDVVALHTAEKYLLLAHHPDWYKKLGRLVAQPEKYSRDEWREKYEAGFMEALATKASVPRHVNTLQHMAGYLKDKAEPEARAEIRRVISDYRKRLVPLIVPITLIRHYVKLHELTYLQGQTYLEPHPKELMLRNHV